MQGSLRPAVDRGSSPARRRAQRVRRTLLFLGGLFLLALLGGMVLLLPARGELETARAALLDGRAALRQGRAGAATEAFARAEEAFAQARETAGNPLTAFIGSVPIVGRTPDAISGLATSGRQVAQAGQVIASALEDLPGGAAALAPRDGAIPLRPLVRLGPPLARAAELLGGADREASAIKTTWVPGLVAGPTEEFVHEVDQLHHALRAAEALVRELPSFLGANEPRRYFFGAQNPAELRGTGGILGAYSILTVRGGALELGPFRDTATLPDVEPDELEPPNPDYARMYDRYGGAGFWKNINMTPDFPSAAAAIERLYEHVTGDAVDGTVMADPFALALLVKVTGAVPVPGADVSLGAERVVPFLANEAYAIFESPPERKRLLGDVAGEVLGTYLEGDSDDPARAADVLRTAAAEGHLLFHAADPGVQDAFELAGVAGRLSSPDADHMGVVVNNGAGNKVDYYMRRSVTYRVVLLPDGVAEADVTAEFVNRAPDEGQPRYVIGPYPGVSEAGENVMIVSTYCGQCSIHDARLDGEQTAVTLGAELDHSVVTDVVHIPSGGAAALAYGWTVLNAWVGGGDSGSYHLTVQGQPTIRPTRLTVEIVAPPGMAVTSVTPGMEMNGSEATWTGVMGDVMSFEVEVARPWGGRVLKTFFGIG